jgi:hypothetical protein
MRHAQKRAEKRETDGRVGRESHANIGANLPSIQPGRQHI